jgi:hypothetical protein
MPDIDADRARRRRSARGGRRPSHRSLHGDVRDAGQALIVSNHFLETKLENLRAAVSRGYARGKLPARDEKDWYD